MNASLLINRLKVEGFRSLKCLDLDLQDRSLIVMVGANGVGKTSVLDAFSMLAASANGELNNSFNSMGGFASNMTYDGQTSCIDFEIDMMIPDREPLQYQLELRHKGTSYFIAKEELSQRNPGYPTPFKHIDSKGDFIKYFDVADDENKLVSPTWEVDPYETSLSQVPKLFGQPESLRKLLSRATLYHTLDVGPHSPVKLPQQLLPVDFPGKNGEYLAPFLYNLRENHSDQYDDIVSTLNIAFPDFESLGFPTAAAGMIHLTWKDKNRVLPFYAHQLSEGRLRFLWLVSLLNSPGLPPITMIDEPETSLHPELISILAGSIRKASSRTQIWVATHSVNLIQNLSPRDVLVMDTDDYGMTTARWGDDPELKLEHWLTDYNLGDVWEMGLLGGRAS